MNSLFARRAGKHIGLGVLLVSTVALLTLVFNFLGTLFCSVLMGMMFGAMRQWKWQTIVVSLVFPAVLLAFVYLAKTELTLQKSILAALLCFGTFWVTYLATCAMLHFERHHGGFAPESAEARSLPLEKSPLAPAANVRDAERHDGASPMAATPLADEAILDELRGVWAREATSPDGQVCRKIIEIASDTVALSLVTADGEVRSCSKGDLRLERLGPLRILEVLGPAARPPLNSAQPLGVLCAWVYTVADHTLTIASNFEAAADGRQPVLETYLKVGSRPPA